MVVGEGHLYDDFLSQLEDWLVGDSGSEGTSGQGPTHTEGQQERDSKLHLSLIQMIRNIAFIYTRLQIWLQIMY